MAAAPIPVPVARKHPLRNPLFRLLWMGSTVSAAGDQFYFVAMPWLVLGLTGSSIALGTIGMVGAIPRAGLMLLGGAVTDRVSPRRIMMLTASARTVLVALVAALLWAHGLHLWQLYVLALCFGIADAFAAPAAQTFMPSLVEAGQLPAAQSVFQSTSQITTLVAPGPAGSIHQGVWDGVGLLYRRSEFLVHFGRAVEAAGSAAARSEPWRGGTCCSRLGTGCVM